MRYTPIVLQGPGKMQKKQNKQLEKQKKNTSAWASSDGHAIKHQDAAAV